MPIDKGVLRAGFMNAAPEYMIQKSYQVMKLVEGLHPVTQLCMLTYPFLIVAHQLDLEVSDVLEATEKMLNDLEGEKNKDLGAMVSFIKDEIIRWEKE